MTYMAEHLALRAQPDQLHPGVLRIISARMDYLPADTETTKLLNQPEKAYISRYALGRDYHKLIRKRLTVLGQKIADEAGEHGLSRVCRQRSGTGALSGTTGWAGLDG